MKFALHHFVFAVIFLAAGFACSPQTNTPHSSTMKQHITIELGVSGADFQAALGRDNASINKQPMGVNFYEIHWPTRLPGTVSVQHGAQSFTVEAVLGVMGMEDIKKQGGVEDIDISSGITAPETMPHEEARQKFMAFLQDLQNKGWKQYYDRGVSRLKGRSSLSDTLELDARYLPTFEEWMALDNGARWNLYANGVYMEISMRRDSDHMNPNLPGSYFLSMDLKTENSFMSLHFQGEHDQANWRALWPERNQRYTKTRQDEENAARAKGLEIDTQYQDPPLLTLTPTAITSKVNQPCPAAGTWEASLPPGHPSATHLASAASRFVQMNTGQAMPEVYASFTSRTAGADNAQVVWTLVKRG